MKTISRKGLASRGRDQRFGLHRRRQGVEQHCGGFIAIITAVTLMGCAGTMPAPVGLTAAPETTALYNTAATFSVGIVPNRAPPVRIGDALGFTLSTSATGYGHVYLLNASGAVLVLAENLLVTGGAQTIFPTPGGGFNLQATPPAGVERVLFLVTRQPFAGFGGGAPGPIQLPVMAQKFVMDLNAATARLPKRGWALTETRVEIVGAGG